MIRSRSIRIGWLHPTPVVEARAACLKDMRQPFSHLPGAMIYPGGRCP
jgi:hypothetical protein